MISLPMTAMRAVAAKRPPGYLEDCLSVGTLSPDGTSVVFTREQYDALVEKYRGYKPPPPAKAQPVPQPPPGPGAELKKLLARIGIKATENCSCNARARKMDEMEAREPGWCEAHLDEIVGWLRDEAAKRKLPFIDAAGRLLVRRAIRNARRAAAG